MNKRFLILFTIGSVALLLGSWFHAIPFSITEDLGFITGAFAMTDMGFGPPQATPFERQWSGVCGFSRACVLTLESDYDILEL
ncbi:MAG: hypothetical protein ACJ8AG_12440 [Ktedonobacteraceae bacterium]|jgi:hypothetical protein